MSVDCFKAYDIRGRVPDELNEDLAWRIGRAFADWLPGKEVIVGHDIRLTSPGMADAVARGLNDGGANVHHIGQGGTEEVYFATAHYGMDGGIMVTASHNPKDYNGMKLVRDGAKPVSGDTGLKDLSAMTEAGEWQSVDAAGTTRSLDHRQAYVDRLVSLLDGETLPSLKIVTDPGNGGAGWVVDALEPRVPFSFERLHHEADGHFPNGVPNPLLVENREATAAKVKATGADFGVAWDGDFDRCFFFDESGRFIEGYYIVGLLAEAFLRKAGSGRIVHDPRLTWNTIAICERFGGTPVQSKTGHAFIKERMRSEDALYGGEMSGHHYFRDFAYCDSGMIPWLLVAELIGRTGKPLSQLVDECIDQFPCSGEINRKIDDPPAMLKALEAEYGPGAKAVDHTDGLSVEFDDWRFNVRASNTEPVVRLNVEAKGNRSLMEAKTEELLGRMGG